MYNAVPLVRSQSGLPAPRSHWALGRASWSRLTPGVTDRLQSVIGEGQSGNGLCAQTAALHGTQPYCQGVVWDILIVIPVHLL